LALRKIAHGNFAPLPRASCATSPLVQRVHVIRVPRRGRQGKKAMQRARGRNTVKIPWIFRERTLAPLFLPSGELSCG